MALLTATTHQGRNHFFLVVETKIESVHCGLWLRRADCAVDEKIKVASNNGAGHRRVDAGNSN